MHSHMCKDKPFAPKTTGMVIMVHVVCIVACVHTCLELNIIMMQDLQTFYDQELNYIYKAVGYGVY